MTQTEKERPGQGAQSQYSLSSTIAQDLLALEAEDKANPGSVWIGGYSPADVRILLEMAAGEGQELHEAYLAETSRILTEYKAERKAEHKATEKYYEAVDRAAPRELPAPGVPMDVARVIVDDYPAKLTYWRGDFYKWNRSHWEAEDVSAIRSWVFRITERATYLKPVKPKDGGKVTFEAMRWAPTITKVREVTTAMGEGVLRREGEAERVLALANGVLENGALLPHTPERFNLTSLPFKYDPAAEPREWLKFLDASLPGDAASHDFLQEWFGYVLSGRTDKHAMASLIGKPRSGKGTIVRVLEAMVGTNHATGITLEQLGSQFGMAGLIGKSLATISEPKWASRQAGEVVEPLLRITGGDRVQVDRKYSQEWIGYLGVRFMILSNDPPRLVNRSGALASRMINVRFPVSFAGREDYGLEPRLLAELPGILNWALGGLKRLDANGRFTVPESHQALQEQFMEYADQDAGFLDAKCVLGQDESATEAEVFLAYQEWCQEAGRRNDSTTSMALRHRLVERDGISARRAGRRKAWTLYGVTVPAHVNAFTVD